MAIPITADGHEGRRATVIGQAHRNDGRVRPPVVGVGARSSPKGLPCAMASRRLSSVLSKPGSTSPSTGAPWHTSRHMHIGPPHRRSSSPSDGNRNPLRWTPPRDSNACRAPRSRRPVHGRAEHGAPSACSWERPPRIGSRASATPTGPSPGGDGNGQADVTRTSWCELTRAIPPPQLWRWVQMADWQARGKLQLRSYRISVSHAGSPSLNWVVETVTHANADGGCPDNVADCA